MTSDAAILPVPTADSQEFWDGCLEGELRMPECLACGHLNWFPRAMCRNCSSTDLRWRSLSGRGKVYTFSIVHRRPTPALPEQYVLALVELDEGPRMLAHVTDCAHESVHVGLPVEVWFDQRSDEIALPMFRPLQ